MSRRCRDCGNTREFRIVYDATFTQYVQADGTLKEDAEGNTVEDVQNIGYSHTICCSCYGTKVDVDVDVIGELPRDHPARLDMGGTGHPEDYGTLSGAPREFTGCVQCGIVLAKPCNGRDPDCKWQI